MPVAFILFPVISYDTYMFRYMEQIFMGEIGELDDCFKSSYPPAAVCTYIYG